MERLTAGTHRRIPDCRPSSGCSVESTYLGLGRAACLPLAVILFTLALPSTGQNLCYDAAGGVVACAGTGQDGETQRGAACPPPPRFADRGDGTVTDNLSGLTWLKNATCADIQSAGGSDWATADRSANALHNGQCLLSDGSVAGDWRLPNVNELESLVDLSRNYPPLPDGQPFTNVGGSW